MLNEDEVGVGDELIEPCHGTVRIVEFLAKFDINRSLSSKKASDVGVNSFEGCELFFVAFFLFGERGGETTALERFMGDESVIVLLDVSVEAFKRRLDGLG